MIEVFTIAGKPYVRAVAAAGEAGLTANYLARLAKNGRLPGRRIGRTWFLEHGAFADFLESRPHSSSEATSTAQ
jgi:hypothetical protein